MRADIVLNRNNYETILQETTSTSITSTTLPYNMQPQPDLDTLVSKHLAKFETEKPYLEALFAHEARGIKLRMDAFVNAGFTNEQAFEYVRTNK